MIFDMAGTITGFFIGANTQFYWFKLIRLIHARTVYTSISLAIRTTLIKFGLNKASAEKIGFTFDLLLYLF